jgi:hypothetical protein
MKRCAWLIGESSGREPSIDERFANVLVCHGNVHFLSLPESSNPSCWMSLMLTLTPTRVNFGRVVKVGFASSVQLKPADIELRKVIALNALQQSIEMLRCEPFQEARQLLTSLPSDFSTDLYFAKLTNSLAKTCCQ